MRACSSTAKLSAGVSHRKFSHPQSLSAYPSCHHGRAHPIVLLDKLFPHRCNAGCTGVRIAYAGECSGAAQAAGVACNCTAVKGKPVCGVDGVTYANSCAAKCARVRISYRGQCYSVSEWGWRCRGVLVRGEPHCPKSHNQKDLHSSGKRLATVWCGRSSGRQNVLVEYEGKWFLGSPLRWCAS